MLLPHIEVLSPEFEKLVLINTRLEKLWTGARWLEGPAWFGGGRYLLVSDIPNNRMLRYDETDGSVSTFRQPAMCSNGNTVDEQGRLITCEHLGRRLSRTEHDGTITTVVDNYQGKKLNSPNDVIVASDGAIWFSDPTYGIDSDYEGRIAESEIGNSNVYRFDPESQSIDIVASDFVKPNGLAFSPDEKYLYISDSGVTHDPANPRHIRRFKVDGKTLSGGEVIAECKVGLFDGLRIDTSGHIWTSSGDSVQCYTAEGKLIGRILIPEVIANICFGGENRNRLFICASTSLYATYVNVSGCPYAKKS